jgi:hypothetical protein
MWNFKKEKMIQFYKTLKRLEKWGKLKFEGKVSLYALLLHTCVSFDFNDAQKELIKKEMKRVGYPLISNIRKNTSCYTPRMKHFYFSNLQ